MDEIQKKNTSNFTRQKFTFLILFFFFNERPSQAKKIFSAKISNNWLKAILGKETIQAYKENIKPSKMGKKDK